MMKNEDTFSVYGIEEEHAPIIELNAATHEEITALVEYCSFASYKAAIQTNWLAALQEEARTLFSNAVYAEQQEQLAYSAHVTGLGPVADRFLRHKSVSNLLTTYFGATFELSEEISCLTFYSTSDHLGPHLDKPAERCSVTIIIYIFAESPDPAATDTGLLLNVYGGNHSSISSQKLQIPSIPGTIVLGRGSEVWHERPRLKQGERVTAITGCFHALS
ncbi:MAG: hypothetical protein ACPG52_00485 [Cognaticolwellia sp.]